jgi:hypothetical protein
MTGWIAMRLGVLDVGSNSAQLQVTEAIRWPDFVGAAVNSTPVRSCPSIQLYTPLPEIARRLVHTELPE